MYFGQSIIQLSTKTRHDPKSGRTSVYRWKGTPIDIEALNEQFVLAGYSTEVDPDDDGGRSVLSVTTSGENPTDARSDAAISDVWSLNPNVVEKEFWDLPVVKENLAILANIHDRVVLRQLFESFVRGDRYVSDDLMREGAITQAISQLGNFSDSDQVPLTNDLIELFLSKTGADTPAIQVFEQLLRDLILGAKSYRVPNVYVLGRRRKFSSNTTFKASKKNVGRIFTTAELIAAEPVPDEIRFDLEDGYWLKETPSVNQVENGKWEIFQEWTYTEGFSPLAYFPPDQ